eukprot:6210508-Pleurochrysis_carterae.AAC.3
MRTHVIGRRCLRRCQRHVDDGGRRGHGEGRDDGDDPGAAAAAAVPRSRASNCGATACRGATRQRHVCYRFPGTHFPGAAIQCDGMRITVSGGDVSAHAGTARWYTHDVTSTTSATHISCREQ